MILWKGNAGAYPYSLGMNGGTMWYSVPTGAIHNFYVNGVSECQINSAGLTVFGNVSTETFSIVDSGSYGANQYQLFMLPPTATTPARIQTIQQGIGYNQNLILQGENPSGNVGIGTTYKYNK
jgi:GH15 family glucan-1,4-alpha-glucosidase